MARELVNTYIDSQERVPEGLEGWHDLTDEEKEAAVTLDDNLTDIVNNEGLTAENIDQFKHLFDGFPYTKEQFQKIKDYFDRQSESVPENKKDSGGKPPKPPPPEEKVRTPQDISDIKGSFDRLTEGLSQKQIEEDPELQKMKDIVDKGTPEPPKPPPPEDEIREPKDNPKDEFTSINKEKQKEIAGAKELFERQQRIKWTDTYDNALHNVQAMYPGENLYDAMKSRVNEFMTMLDNGVLFNPTSEDIAVFNVFKNQTLQKIGEIQGFDSPDTIKRQLASARFADLQNDLFHVVQVNNPKGEAGRAFNLLQSEIANDPENGLQIRRIQLQQAKGGEPLTEDELEQTSDQWEKEKADMQRENDLKQKIMQEKFEKELSKIKESFTKKPPSKGAKLSIEEKKTVANKLRNFADKFEKFGRADLPEGTERQGVDFQKAVANGIRYIADKIESGHIPDLIEGAIKKFIVKGGDENEFRNTLKGALSDAGIDAETINAPTTTQVVLEKIKALNSTDITTDMVGKNLIRDYVNSHIGIHDQKDILDEAYNGLKKVLPELEKSKLLEAYLKENEFKQPTKKQLIDSEGQAKKQLANIARLEEDLNDLKGYKETRQRSFPTERERIEYEKKLAAEKEGILKDRQQKKATATKEYQNLESERNRQQKKVGELQAKKAQLERGIVDKRSKIPEVKDTPEIEGLKADVSKLEKDIRDAENARKEAEKKIERDRNSKIQKDNQALETERNRQLKIVNDLTERKNKLEQGIREKRIVNKKVDTPEIESLKKQVTEADKNLRDAENEVSRINREADKKTAQLAQYNIDIQRVKQGLDLQKRGKSKPVSEIDKDIAAKQKELSDTMRDMGVKTSTADKYAKASNDQRAKAHNDRLEGIGKLIDEKLSKSGLPAETEKALQNLKGKLDAAKIKLDPNSALSQDKTLQGGLDILKAIKSEFSRNGDVLNTNDIVRPLQKAIDKFTSDKNESEQDVKLQRAKDKARRDADEFKRKIAAGEFEDNPITTLTKSDAELIKLQRDRELNAEKFYKEKKEFDKKNQKWYSKVANLARSAFVNTLIGGIGANREAFYPSKSGCNKCPFAYLNP